MNSRNLSMWRLKTLKKNLKSIRFMFFFISSIPSCVWKAQAIYCSLQLWMIVESENSHANMKKKTPLIQSSTSSWTIPINTHQSRSLLIKCTAKPDARVLKCRCFDVQRNVKASWVRYSYSDIKTCCLSVRTTVLVIPGIIGIGGLSAPSALWGIGELSGCAGLPGILGHAALPAISSILSSSGFSDFVALKLIEWINLNSITWLPTYTLHWHWKRLTQTQRIGSSAYLFRVFWKKRKTFP